MKRKLPLHIAAIALALSAMALQPAAASGSDAEPGQETRDYYLEAEEQYMDGDYSTAILTSLEGLRNEPAQSDSAAAVELYSILGAAYSRLGDFDRAADYMVLCYNYDTEHGDSQGLSSSLINLASVYVYADKPELGEQYALRAIENELPLGRPLKLAMAYGKACDVYHALGNKAETKGDKALATEMEEKALLYADKAVETVTAALKEAPDSTLIKTTLNALAIRRSQRAYPLLALERYNETLSDLNAARAIFLENGNRQSLAIVNYQLAQTHRELGNTTSALQFCNEAYNTASQLNDLPLLEKICRTQSEMLATRNPSEALKYLNEASALRDTINAHKDRDQLALYNIEFETEKNRHTIELLDERTAQQHTQIIMLLVITLLFLGLATLMTVSYRRSQIAKMKTERLSRQKDRLMSIISHDLRSPAIAQYSALKSLSSAIGTIPAQELKAVCQELERSAGFEVNLIENVLRWARSKSTGYNIVAVPFNTTDAVKETIQEHSYAASRKNITISFDGPDNAVVRSDRDTFLVVMRNLLSNAIKFSEPGGIIEVKVSNADTPEDTVITSVTDHGAGIPAEEMSNLFSPEKKTVRKGSMGESGSGLGLTVCSDLIKALGGTIRAESQPGKYTTFTFTVPDYTQPD